MVASNSRGGKNLSIYDYTNLDFDHALFFGGEDFELMTKCYITVLL